MRTILHILTHADDDLARDVIAKQSTLADTQLQVVELPEAGADYTALVEQIFAADSVEVW